MESINVPKLKIVAGSGFYTCQRLISIALPAIEQIGSSGFSCCYNLESIQLGDGLTKVGDYAFYKAQKLTELVFGPNVTNIGGNMTNGCTLLERVEFHSVPTKINSQAFYNTPSLTDIYVPWAEGAVANAPWGATNATIHYETTYGEGE